MSYLKECILSVWEDTKKPRTELEAFLTLREYFKSPSADTLIQYDPQIYDIYKVTNSYLRAWQLYREGVAVSSEAQQLEDKSPNAEGEVIRLYEEAEEKLTEAMQIVSGIGLVKGALYFAIVSALSNLPTKKGVAV